MQRTIHWFEVSAAMLLATLLALPAGAQDDRNGQNGDKRKNGDTQAPPPVATTPADPAAGETGQKGDKQAQADSEKDQTRRLKAFDLEHRKPQEIQQILALRKQAAPAHTPGQTLAPGQPPMPQQRTAGFRPHQQQLAFAADDGSGVLFVRGPSDQVKEVEELVNALDVASGELKKHEIGDTRLIPISKDSTAQVRSTLTQLQLNHQLMQLDDVSLIAVFSDGSDEHESTAKQVEEVISKLGADKDLGDSDQDSSDQDTEREADVDIPVETETPSERGREQDSGNSDHNDNNE